MTERSSVNRFTDFWWGQRVNAARFAALKGMIAGLTTVYFLSCLSDLNVWFGPDGILSKSRVATFVTSAGLTTQAKWYVSPLWWTDSSWSIAAAAILGVGLSIAVMWLRHPSTWLVGLLWACLVAVVNRYLLVTGLAESLLSLTVFALAIACVSIRSDANGRWTSFGLRWMQCQFTAVALVTAAAMLSREVWWNGLGVIALAEPFEARLLNLTDSVITRTWVHDLLSTYLVLALPLGTFLAWKRRTRIWGVGMLVIWGGLIAVIGSHWLYGAAFAVNAFAFTCLEEHSDSRNE